MAHAPLPEYAPLRVLVCGVGAARLVAGACEAAPASPASPWHRLEASGRPVLLADGGDSEAGLGRIAALAPLGDALLLVVGGEEPTPLARRQAGVARLLGVRHLVVGSEEAETRAAHLAEPLGFPVHHEVRLGGDANAHGPLLAVLESLVPDPAPADAPFRLPVETVGDGGAGAVLAGTIVSGHIRPGDALVAAGSGRGATVVSIQAQGGERAEASSGETVTLHLDRATGASAGEVLAAAGDRPESCDQFAARLLWLDDEPLLPGRPYGLRIGAREVVGSVTRIKHRIEGASAAPLAAGTLRAGDEGQVNLSLAEPVVFEPFERRRALGSFTLTDRSSGRTVAAGTIGFALRRAANIHRQAVDVTKAARAAAKAQRPALLWFTGLSGAGKSTIANLVERRLFALGHHTYLLDGDNVRHGLNRDLGFTAQDRVENIRRVAETAKLMVDAGLITLASFISPFRAERQLARDLLAAGEFIEVFVDAPLSVAESRDPKGLYAQARAGRIPNFTGIDSPYEAPDAPELHLHTDRRSADDLADDVVEHLRAAGFLAPGAG